MIVQGGEQFSSAGHGPDRVNAAFIVEGNFLKCWSGRKVEQLAPQVANFDFRVRGALLTSSFMFSLYQVMETGGERSLVSRRLDIVIAENGLEQFLCPLIRLGFEVAAGRTEKSSIDVEDDGLDAG